MPVLPYARYVRSVVSIKMIWLGFAWSVPYLFTVQTPFICFYCDIFLSGYLKAGAKDFFGLSGVCIMCHDSFYLLRFDLPYDQLRWMMEVH